MLKKRLPGLDFLRGIAILLVLGHHFPNLPSNPVFLLWPFQIWMRAGWIGVDLFFVLSGFLVSSLLFTEYIAHGNLRPGLFFIRRGLKIYPAFYVMLILSVTWIFQHISLKHILTEGLFVQNYLMGSSNIWSHTWSLAIEEHFYLLLVLLLYGLSRRRCKEPFGVIVPIFIAVAVSSLALRWIGFIFGVPPQQLFLRSHYRMDGLFFGVFLSYLHHFRNEKFRTWVLKYKGLLMLCSPLLILPAFLTALEGDFFLNTCGLTFLYLGFGAILALVLHRPQGVIGSPSHGVQRFISFIGFYSYSIYLWHVPWRKITLGVLHKYLELQLGFIPEAAIYFTLAICEGVLMAKIIELPFLKWRDRLFPSRSA